MHSTLTRLQSLFSLATTVAFTLSALIALTPFLQPFLPTSLSSSDPSSPPSAAISLHSAQVVRGRPHYYSTRKEEYAHVRFSLDADLSSLFTWNTKQLFVWVSVVYPSSTSKGAEQTPLGPDVPMSNAVIWDAIVPAPATTFAYQNVRARYLDPIGEYVTDLYSSYFAAKKPPPGSKSKSKSKLKPKPKPSSRKSSSPSPSSNTKAISKPGLLHLPNQKPKYQITDISGVLAERANATLQLGWNVQPWVGALVWDTGCLGGYLSRWESGKSGKSGVSATWQFPALKGTGSKKEGVKTEGGGGGAAGKGAGTGTGTEAERREGRVREEGRAEPVGPTG